MFQKFFCAVLLCVLTSPVFAADPDVQLGVLKCRLTDVENEIVYSEEKFACHFQHKNGEVESYIGEIKKVGLDLSVKKDFTLIWYVLAASLDTYKSGMLAGTYVGGAADVAVGEGGGAEYLTGGFNKLFNLQTYALDEEKGTGISLGIEKFELK